MSLSLQVAENAFNRLLTTDVTFSSIDGLGKYHSAPRFRDIEFLQCRLLIARLLAT